MLGFGSCCLDLGYLAEQMDGRTDGWTDSPCVLHDSIPFGGHNIGLRGHNDVPQARIRVFWQDLGHFAWIWVILSKFGPYCLDLGYLAELGSE